MPSGVPLTGFFRSLYSVQARLILRRNSAACHAQVRFFSEQSPSPLGEGKEKGHAQDGPGGTKGNSSGKEKKERSAHAQFYSDTVPAMIPIALLGSAVYIGLQLMQTKLSTEKYLDEANARIAQLEEEIGRLQSEQEARDSAASGRPEGGSDTTRAPSRWWFA